MTRSLVAVTCVLIATGPLAIDRQASDIRRLPHLMVWAWERPVDLRHLPDTAGVAFLAQTVEVDGETFVKLPRRQPLQVNPRTPLMAVTRVEAARKLPASDTEIDALAAAIAFTSKLPNVSAIQVDFDATRSQRDGYRRLLHAIRRALPPRVPLSMTALASWCTQDNWLDDLPVDEAVPMLFRMGRSERPFAGASGTPFRAPICRGAVGISRDEPASAQLRADRVYVFDPGGR